MLLMLTILFVTIALFIWGKLPPDIVALISMMSLFLFGVLDYKETLSGFSNSTVIMIAALFVLGEGISSTGWTAMAGRKFVDWAGNSSFKLLTIISMGGGVLSGFVSNTGTVATLMPLTIASAWTIGSFPSKFLMPLAFGSNTGGLLTLVGTPPNIIVSNALVENGFEGFSFFEFSLIGLPLLIATIVYFRFIGHRFLPTNKTKNKPVDIDATLHEWIEAYQVGGDYYRLRIRSRSPLINTTLEASNIEDEFDVKVIRLRRRHPSRLKGTPPVIEIPVEDTEMRYHDIITVQGETEAINKMMIKYRLGLLPLEPIQDELRHNLINQEVGMTEILITPRSHLVGRKIMRDRFFKRFDIQLLAASRDGKPLVKEQIVVHAGDAFLIRGAWKNIEILKEQHQHVVICGSPEGMAKDVDNLNLKSYIALAALAFMIILMMFKIVPSAIAALLGAGVVVLTGCVPMAKIYKSIGWTSVIMIAAMIPMGTALQKTGAAQLIANNLVDYLGVIHPVVLLAGIYLLTTTFSQVISNSATAVLMAPIALLAAASLNLSPEPFMIVVAVSASTAFLTPIGTTTNAMVISSGDYKFMDYFRVGAPLLLLLFTITMLIVPAIWPL